MEIKELPASKYIVFSLRAKCEDSLQPVADDIYKEWFPQATCHLNENARYDFAKYGEQAHLCCPTANKKNVVVAAG